MASINQSSRLRSLAFSSTLALFASACSGSEDVTRTDTMAPAGVPQAPASAPEASDGLIPPDPSDDPAAHVDRAWRPEVFAANFAFADGPASDQAPFIEMSDGVRLAASLYFPVGAAQTGARSPVVYVDEWYGRADEKLFTAIDLYRQAGFVVALVDARGYGASFGSQATFLSERSRQDQREVLAWLAAQPWSNGRISSIGISLSGALAAMVAGSGSQHLGAAVIRAADYDEYTMNLYPGGVPNDNTMAMTIEFVAATFAQPCIDDASACPLLGVEPADGDDDGSLLQAAMRDHAGNIDAELLLTSIYHDDRLGEGGWSNMTPVEHPDVRVPARLVVSWVDGLTADSALTHYASHPNTPLQVTIGSNTHPGGLDGDPFATTPFAEARPSARESFGDDIEFIQRVDSGEPIAREIRYVVLGTDRWETSDTWPPAGVVTQSLALASTTLVAEPPAAAAELAYRVDPTTSTGALNRWASQRGSPIHYGDRRNAPGRLLSFDAAPVAVDTEIAGNPELCVTLTTDQTDGIVLAYLEDVAPDGRVTYLSEGELRLMHRNTAGSACDPAPGAARSFERKDAAAVVPGTPMQLEIPFTATAALLRRGHHLRLSLAGADAGTFGTLTDTPATWSVGYGGPDGSTLRVPMRPWQDR
jgi:uncharacterized protein